MANAALGLPYDVPFSGCTEVCLALVANFAVHGAEFVGLRDAA